MVKIMTRTSLTFIGCISTCVLSCAPEAGREPLGTTQAALATAFSDNFTASLSQWSESGEGDWNTESLHSSSGYPGSASGQPAAHVDDCDSECTITSPVINLAGATSGTLRFLRFVDSEFDSSDYARVELWNGTAWIRVRNWSGGSGDTNTWTSESVDLAPYVGRSDFRLRFVARASDTSEHFQIDDVQVTTDSTAGFTSADIGSTGLSGSTSQSGSLYTIAGAGADIGGSSDAFRFVYQALTGDGEVTARIQTLTQADAWTKAGLMFRQSTNANAPNAVLGLRPTQGSFFQHRATAGGVTASSWQETPDAASNRYSFAPTPYGVRYLKVPKWLKLTRQGKTVRAYSSDDGACWTLRWQQALDFASSTILAGVAVTSHTTGALAQATFSGFEVRQGVPSDVNQACPRALVDGDLAQPTTWIVAPGSAGNGGTWSYTTTDPNPPSRPVSCLEGGDLTRRRYSPDATVCPADTIDGAWAQPGFTGAGWLSGPGGFGPTSGSGTATQLSSRAIWLRKELTLSSAQASSLVFWGRWTDSVSIYVNGVLATNTYNSNLSERYHYLGMNDRARAALRPNAVNAIAVRVECVNCDSAVVDMGLALNSPLAQLPRQAFVTSATYRPWGDAVYDYTKEMGSLGGVFAVKEAGSIAISESLGWANRAMTTSMPRDAVLRLASVDKVVTQAALIKAYNDGLLRPDARVFGEILNLTPMPGATVGQRVQQITLDQLRLHKSLISGIGGVQAWHDELAFRFGLTSAENLTKHHLARVLYSSDTECVPRADGSVTCIPGEADAYSSNGYFLIRYVLEQVLAPKTLEQYLAQDMGASDIVLARERLAGRHPREPGYRIVGEPTYSRWFALEEYLALSASATALVNFFDVYAAGYDRQGNVFTPTAGGMGGSMSGTRSGLGADPFRDRSVALIWNSDLAGSTRLDDKLAILDNSLNPGSCNPPALLGSKFRINNYWRGDQYLNVENVDNQNPTFNVLSSEIQSHWESARWLFQPVSASGGPYYVIRNAWQTDRIIHLQNGVVKASNADPSTASAHWFLDDRGTYFRLRSRQNAALYLNIEGGTLQATDLPDNFHSTRWYLCN